MEKEEEIKSIERVIDELKIDQMSVDQIIEKIAESTGYEGPSVGFGHSASITYSYFHQLKKIITVEQCVNLIKNHPSPVVKCYVFEALSLKDTTQLYDLVFDSLKNWKTRIYFTYYDILSKYSIPDYFFTCSSSYLTNQQLKNIVLEIEKNDYRPRFREGMYDNLQPAEIDHDWLKELINKSKDANGLILLAKFKNENDIQIIIDSISKKPSLAYEAMGIFQTQRFWEILVSKYQEGLNSNSYWWAIHSSVVLYKKIEAVKIFKDSLTKLDKNSFEMHARDIYKITKNEPIQDYAELFLMIFERSGISTLEHFEYFKNHYYQDVLRISEKWISDKDELYQRESNSRDFLNIYWKINYENELTLACLYTMYEVDIDKTVQILTKNFDSINISNLYSISKFIIAIDNPVLIEKMFARAISDNNTHVRRAMINYLRTTPNSKYNSRVDSLLKEHPNLLNFPK